MTLDLLLSDTTLQGLTWAVYIHLMLAIHRTTRTVTWSSG